MRKLNHKNRVPLNENLKALYKQRAFLTLFYVKKVCFELNNIHYFGAKVTIFHLDKKTKC